MNTMYASLICLTGVAENTSRALVKSFTQESRQKGRKKGKQCSFKEQKEGHIWNQDKPNDMDPS